MKRLKCKVCETEFIPTVEAHYEAVQPGAIFQIGTRYDAFDCPQCGSQIIAKERYQGVCEDNEPEEEDGSENKD